MKKILLKNAKYIGLLFIALSAALAWVYTPLSDYTDAEKLSELLQGLRQNPFALIWIIGLYVVAALMFFPVTVLSGTVILLYGGILGFIYATIGAVAGACVGFAVGHWIGLEKLEKNLPHVNKTVDSVRESGVIGMTIIRMVPIAPFSIVNMVLGAISVPITSFILGTILGMAPGKIVLALFGDTLLSLFTEPTLKKSMIAVIGLIIWIAIVWLCNVIVKRWQDNNKTASA